MIYCKFAGCDRRGTRKGLCATHRTQRLNGKPLTAIRQTVKTPASKKCKVCKETKQRADFYKDDRGHLESWCKTCSIPRSVRIEGGYVPTGPCKYETCDRLEAYGAKGWCRAHYVQNYRGMTLAPIRKHESTKASVPGLRKCTTCKQEKNPTDFHKKSGRDVLNHECRFCTIKRTRINYLLKRGRLEEAGTQRRLWDDHKSLVELDVGNHTQELNTTLERDLNEA